MNKYEDDFDKKLKNEINQITSNPAFPDDWVDKCANCNEPVIVIKCSVIETINGLKTVFCSSFCLREAK